MKRLVNWRIISLLAALTLILSGCGGEPYLSALQPAGEVAQMEFNLMALSTFIMVGVVAVVVIIFILVLIKFRRKDDRIPKQVEGSHKLEIIWTVIPILLLLILAVPTIITTFKLADVSAMDNNSKALVVNVRSHLYWWDFEYPNQKIVTSQELVVPTNERVYFNLKSMDVKHSFWIPAVGGKLDTNPDNVNKFWLEFDNKKANEAGNLFYGKCAELCGPSHALMDFKVKAMPRAEFNNWVASMQKIKTAAPATSSLALEGQKIFNQSCIGCHAVTPANTMPDTARLAPNLTNFGDRSRVAGILPHTKEDVKKWIKNPESFKPGNKMTGKYPQMTDAQLNALAEYLMGLKVQQ